MYRLVFRGFRVTCMAAICSDTASECRRGSAARSAERVECGEIKPGVFSIN